MRISKLRSSTVRCARSIDFGDHLRFEGHVVGEGAVHHPVHGAGCEQPHEVVFERQVEAALARVALTAGRGLGAGCRCGGSRGVRYRARRGHRASARGRPRPCTRSGNARPAAGSALRDPPRASGPRPSSSASARPSGLPPRRMSTPRPAMLVATVTRAGPAGLRDDVRLPLVLLGVQHRVRDAALARAGVESCSDFSTEIVPTRTGWPASHRSAMSSAAASNFASSDL